MLKEIIFLNGKQVDAQEAKVSALSDGLLCGWGCFETMRSLKGKIVYLDAHLTRLISSAKLLGLKLGLDLNKLRKSIKEALEISAFNDAYVRLTVWKSRDKCEYSIIARQYKPQPRKKYSEGFSCMVSDVRQNEFSPLSRIKSTSRLFYQLALNAAQGQGFDEAVMLNTAGVIAEAARGNLFIVKNRELFTPPIECGCLEGITRQAIFDLAKKNKIAVREARLSLQNLYEADEAFLVNSLMGIMPIKRVEGHKIGKVLGKDSLINLLQEKYRLLFKDAS